jgi:hypothetical protein
VRVFSNSEAEKVEVETNRGSEIRNIVLINPKEKYRYLLLCKLFALRACQPELVSGLTNNVMPKRVRHDAISYES